MCDKGTPDCADGSDEDASWAGEIQRQDPDTYTYKIERCTGRHQRQRRQADHPQPPQQQARNRRRICAFTTTTKVPAVVPATTATTTTRDGTTTAKVTTTQNEKYSLMDYGTCPSPHKFIASYAECSAAARALDLGDTSATRIATNVNNNRADVPHGCYWFVENQGNFRLFWNEEGRMAAVDDTTHLSLCIGKKVISSTTVPAGGGVRTTSPTAQVVTGNPVTDPPTITSTSTSINIGAGGRSTAASSGTTGVTTTPPVDNGNNGTNNGDNGNNGNGAGASTGVEPAVPSCSGDGGDLKCGQACNNCPKGMACAAVMKFCNRDGSCEMGEAKCGGGAVAAGVIIPLLLIAAIAAGVYYYRRERVPVSARTRAP